MAIEKYFDYSASIVFDPVPAYDGEWSFRMTNLLKNAKREKGINLFEAFYEETFIRPLKSVFKHIETVKSAIGFISMPNDSRYGRCLKYNKYDFYMSLISLLDFEIDKVGKTPEEHQKYINYLLESLTKSNEEINKIFSDELKLKLEKLKDLDNKGFASIYFDAARVDAVNFTGSDEKLSTFIKNMIEVVSDYQKGLLKLGDFFENQLDFEKLFKCFEPDTFYLLFATIIYEINQNCEAKQNTLDNNYIYMYNYFSKMEDISKEDKRYDPYILYTWNTENSKESQKNERVTRRSLQIKYEEMMKRHPECKPLILPKMSEEDISRFKDINLVEKIAKLYDDEVTLNWEFLPEGELVSSINSDRIAKEKSSEKKVLIDEILERISILEKSGYLKCIRGKNTFNGYYAFVYANGNIILEKFWDNEDELKPSSKHNATYIMTIDNFLELSKLSRTNLVEYIKTFPSVGVRRIFHTTLDNWHRNIYNAVNGAYRMEDALDFINRLKSDGVRR